MFGGAFLKRTYTSIEAIPIVALPVIQIISGEVLTASRSLKVTTNLYIPSLEIITLDPSHVWNCILPCYQWVFARCLLPSSPSRVPKYVNIGCPKCHPRRLSRIVHCSCLYSDGLHKFIFPTYLLYNITPTNLQTSLLFASKHLHFTVFFFLFCFSENHTFLEKYRNKTLLIHGVIT